MHVNLRDIPAEGLTFDQVLQLSDATREDGERLVAGAARWSGTVEPANGSYELSGRLVCTLQLQCSRCLADLEHPLAVDVRLRIVGAAAKSGGAAETQLTEADATLLFAAGGRADLRAVAVEQLYLSLPLKPVCMKNCAGLCPACGANRNRIECSCRALGIDPRLAPLLDLKQKI